MIALLQAPLRHKAAALPSGHRQHIDILGGSSLDHLQWLCQQSTYPRFYWQSRDGELEIAAVGAAREFYSLKSAQEFIHYCAPTDFQPLLVGGIPFSQHSEADSSENGLHGFLPSKARREVFFLPKKALVRRGQHTFLVRFVRLGHGVARAEGGSLSLLVQQVSKSNDEFPHLVTRKDQPNRKQWDDLVNKVIQPDALALTPKVVLARRTRFLMQKNLDQFAMLRRWKQIEPHTMPYMLQLAQDSCFLGCTPERLYRRRDRDIVTEALAGTIEKLLTEPAGALSASALRSDVKIRRENYLVQDYIKKQLMPLCDSVQVSPVADVIELKFIQHLRKLITGKLKTHVSDDAIIRALHPTPAVGGSPRGEALDFIANYEPFRRGWYAGAIGYLSADEAEFSVAIRSAEIRGRLIDFYAGAGIVAGSEASAEWQELDNKIESVINLFECADNLISL